jgi:DNA-binding NarL/FixJ family response regulator
VTTYGLAGKPLTDREMGILVAVAEGCTDTAIAHELVISSATVKGHVARIKERLGAASRPNMVAIAYHRRILRIPGVAT